MSINRVVLVGRITKDPEQNSTPNGISVCRFTLAVDRRFKNKDGEKEADFLSIIAWRETAEACGKYLRKGSQCAVEGSIQTRSYEANDGSRRYVTEIMADNVQFLGGKPADENDPSQPPTPPKHPKKPVSELSEVNNDDDLPF